MLATQALVLLTLGTIRDNRGYIRDLLYCRVGGPLKVSSLLNPTPSDHTDLLLRAIVALVTRESPTRLANVP